MRIRGPNFDWTDAAVASLRRMLTVEGLSMRQAACQLGTNKNVCHGKAKRLGLKPIHQRVYATRKPTHHGPAERRYGPRAPVILKLGAFAPNNITGRLMGDPPPGRTPWAMP